MVWCQWPLCPPGVRPCPQQKGSLMMAASDLCPVNISILAAQNKPPLFTTCFRAKTSNTCCLLGSQSTEIWVMANSLNLKSFPSKISKPVLINYVSEEKWNNDWWIREYLTCIIYGFLDFSYSNSPRSISLSNLYVLNYLWYKSPKQYLKYIYLFSFLFLAMIQSTR